MSEVFRIPMEEELSRRMGWLIRLRWVAALGELVIVLAANYLLPDILPLLSLWATIAGLAICNTIFLLYAQWLRSLEVSPKQYAILIHLQLLLDLVFLTFFLHFLGGLETPFFFFYLVYVVIASILLPKAGSFACAGLASSFYIALLLLEWRGIIPHYNLTGFRIAVRFQQPIHIFTVSFTLTCTSFLAAYFVSSIVAALRERGRELLEATLSCEVRAEELAELNARLKEREQELLEANLSCEVRAQELAELNVKLEELDKARSQFIYLVTHELRAPVAAIQSYLKLILEGYVPAEREREIIQRAEQRALDQLALISDLLEWARLEEPRTEVEVESLDLGEVLRGVSDLVRAQAEEKELFFSVDIAPDLPPVKANLEHMKQLWTNLISNAIKYTIAGGTVAVSLTRNAEGIVGRVQDTGIGIAPEDLPRIFEEFYRAENAKAMERHGTGLGLSIARRIVETYGGQIWAESELGRGSTFTFVLPV